MDLRLPKQVYSSKPLTKDEIRGASSQTIFKFMTTPYNIIVKESEDEIQQNIDKMSLEVLNSNDLDYISNMPPLINKIQTKLDKLSRHYPNDVDDFERNRALLLWYPEWKERLTEMSILGQEWKNLTKNWSTIEQLYDQDYLQYGNKAFKGECNQYISNLVTL